MKGKAMSEKVTALCSYCDKEIDTTRAQLQERHKCPLCDHGDLQIISGDYDEIRRTIAQAAEYLKNIPEDDRQELVQPLIDLLSWKAF